MAVQVTLKDNSKIVLNQLKGNKEAALTAMGIKSLNLILHQMQQGYGKPIRITGDLQRDVQYEVDKSDSSVTVGNTLVYGKYVHEGTYKMTARPYIRDALTGENHKKQLEEVASAALKKGF